VIEMLYQDKALGQPTLGTRIAARLAIVFSRRRHADLDLLAMSPHLRRDLGLETPHQPAPLDYIWRK
jgi:hypothetical protein